MNSSLSTPKMSVRAAIVLLIVSLIVASCGGSDDTDLSRADDASTETERPTAAPVDVAELDTEATGEEADAPAVVFANEECESTTSIRLATYDSFVVSEGVFEVVHRGRPALKSNRSLRATPASWSAAQS